jgi:hypothetical protein
MVTHITGYLNTMATLATLSPDGVERDIVIVGKIAAHAKKQILWLTDLGPPDALAVNAAISMCALPEDAKNTLLLAVMEQVSRLASADGTGGDYGQKGQLLLYPHHFCIKDDIEYIGDRTHSQLAACLRMRQAMNKVNCVRPAEKTYAAMAAMLACLRDPDMLGAALYVIVNDLKQVMPDTTRAASSVRVNAEAVPGATTESAT